MDSATIKERLKKEMVENSNVANARLLLDKLQDNCFQSCIQKPGTSLSSSDQTCFTNCIDKYIQAWNTVNNSYINKIRQMQNGA
ncbi:mitochondrial import inner membrane translocase subunit TIM13 [Stachybotrys elegans]|uniref:Mitochondrial import inner membrane translocase subunit n=1 Tax=Stachybotrys elegans TaxID=80388 RepID=A0A8K0WWC0_9HYPO|nr:mitochondrial import inner membrane translocase subunit TIM13 [Stachybotrys elegans]